MLHSTNDRDLVVDTGVRKRWSSWGVTIPGIGLATLLGGVDVMTVFLLLWYQYVFWLYILVEFPRCYSVQINPRQDSLTTARTTTNGSSREGLGASSIVARLCIKDTYQQTTRDIEI